MVSRNDNIEVLELLLEMGISPTEMLHEVINNYMSTENGHKFLKSYILNRNIEDHFSKLTGYLD